MDQSRRDLIKKGAAAGAAAWAAPVIVTGTAAPAVAASPVDPCAVPQEKFAVALYSPPGGGLVDRPNILSSFTTGSCVSEAPFKSGDAPDLTGYDLTTSAAIGLSFTTVDISHNISSLSQQPVTLTLSDTCCVIDKITAHIHQFAAPTNPDCPDPYYRVAGDADNHLLISAGGYGTQTITIQPSSSTAFCGPSLHWGSPNTSSSCPGSVSVNSYGQPLGYMLIELTCNEGGPPG